MSYRVLREKDVERLRDGLSLDRFANEETKTPEIDVTIAPKQDVIVTVSKEYDDEVGSIAIEVDREVENPDADSFSDLSPICSDLCADIREFFTTNTEMSEEYFRWFPTGGPPYRTHRPITFRADVINVDTVERTVTIRGCPTTLNVPIRHVENGTVDEFVENWWKWLPNRTRLDIVDLTSIEDESFSVGTDE